MPDLSHWLAAYPVLAPVIFILARSLAIIIPPIPGVVVDLAGIAAFGWWPGLLYGQAGVMLGAMVAFWLGRFFGEKLVSRFFPVEKIHAWEATLSDKQKFWGLVGLRLMTNAIFDYLSYAAGLTRIGAWKFFLASFLGTLPSAFIFYRFGDFLFSRNYLYLAGSVLVTVIVLTYLKKRWTEKHMA